MINPKDVMIGNFVSHNGVANSGKIIAPIEAIYEKFDRSIIVAGVRDSIENFEPIPLTEKIVLDSGFRFDMSDGHGCEQFKSENGFLVVLEDGDVPYFSYLEYHLKIKETQFVHNLQNAYRLATGQDLDLVINDYSTTI